MKNRMGSTEGRYRKWWRSYVTIAVGVWCGVLISGCGYSRPVELSASRVMLGVSQELRQAIEEYHYDLAQLDDQREQLAVGAFIEQVKESASSEEVLASLEEKFRAAMNRGRLDREVAWRRYVNSVQNLAVLQEVAHGVGTLGAHKESASMGGILFSEE